MTLVQHLLEKRIFNQEKADSLEKEIKKSGKREEEVILAEKIVPESALFNLKSQVLKLPLKEVEVDQISLGALELIPEETAQYYQMIPIHKRGNSLEVGMVYPEDLKAQEALNFLARQEKFNYEVFLIAPTTFKNILKQYRTLKKEVGMALQELETEAAREIKEGVLPVDQFKRMAEEAPITKIVDVVLRHAVDGGASDIHIEPTKEKLRIRFRSLGVLYSSLSLPMKIHPAIVARVKIVAILKIDETRIPQDGRFSANFNGKIIDFRVSTLPTTLGEKVVIRVLDPSTGMKKFEDLGLEGRNLKAVREGISKPYGLVLSTGPTGSGKTTTLYAILQLLNKGEVNVVTLEDPAEYFIEGVNQSQVKPEIGYTFSSGLRHILRQDPDIIMVGEIRDEETASLVIHAALTGHVVLSTLHTSNALGAIPRLIDMGVAPYLIPPTLQLIVAQRLIRRLCDHCKKKIKPESRINDLILKEIESFSDSAKNSLKVKKPLTVFASQGCAKCHNVGFSGRIGVFEILTITKSLADIILKDPSENAIKKEAEKQGMITMRQDGVLKVLSGLTTMEEVLKVSEEQ